MPILVKSRRLGKDTLLSDFPDAVIIDTTSQGILPYRKLSPFYPHGAIPVSFSPNQYAASVEGIWQGLKVFVNDDVDVSKFSITTMKGLKRSSRSLGKVLGHRKGVNGNELLDYVSAKREIYIPTYKWILENYLQEEITNLVNIASKSTLILLDYNTATDIFDPIKPISHAALCKLYIEESFESDNL